MTYTVGIAGASGYAGGELLRLLDAHPEFEVAVVAAGGNSGNEVTSVHPQLLGWQGVKFAETNPADLNACDLVFVALPHGASAALVKDLTSPKVVDLGADFRLLDAQQWSKFYGSAHAGSWQYGLPELAVRTEIAGSSRVANPGCYATAISLAAAPLLRSELIDPLDLVAVAASGTSGAGRNPAPHLLASEVMGSIGAYKVGGAHQHTPEIEQTLSTFSGVPVRLSFTPLLAPMPRGIHATVSARLTGNGSLLREAFEFLYADEPFITLMPVGVQPRTGSVIGSNQVQIQVEIDDHANRVVVTVVLDNLVKGAAGQALQNANLMFGLPESMGLKGWAVAP